MIPTSGRHPHRGRGVSDITCRFETINVLDPLGAGGGDAGNPADLPVGTQTWRSCYSTSTGARVEGPTLYTTTAPGPGGARNVTAELIDMALANIDIDLPVPHLSPPGQTVPNVTTWLWTEDIATQTASATASGVTITVTATLATTRYEINPSDDPAAASTDDHVVIVCAGAPHAFDPARPEREQATTCSHRFAAPTRDVTIDTTVTWRATWTASNGTSGDLGTIDRTVTMPYRVQEKETVIRTSG